MTDFDEIIKQKVDGKKYPYSAKAWQSFASKAGIKSALTLGQSVIIGAISVAVLSVGGFALYKHLNTSDNGTVPAHPASPTEVPVTVVADTLAEQSVIEDEGTVEVVSTRTKPAADTEVVPAQETKSQQDTVAAPVKKAPILRPKNNRRILEIRTDTIKSND